MNGEPHKNYDFGEEIDDFKADDWTPNPVTNDEKPRPSKEQVAEVAAAQGFTSREPKPEPQKELEGQITIRGKQRTMEEFRAFAASQEPKWPLGYTLERALAALKRELAG
jgi:hypothetical protein